MAIILGIILFMILILIHELGHFLAAKKSGVKVEEFGIGIPPKLFKVYTDKSGTEYTVNLIPLGGFVKLKGENPENVEEFRAKDSFMGVNIWKQLVILLGGISMNLIFAWILFTIIFTIGIRPMQILPKNALDIESNSYLVPTYDFLNNQGFISGKVEDIPVKVIGVMPDSLALKAGLKEGDILTSIGDQKANSVNIGDLLKDKIGKTFKLGFKRGDQNLSSDIKCPDDACLLGIQHDSAGDAVVEPIKFNLIQSMGVAGKEMYAETILTYHLLGKLVANLVSGDKAKVKNSVAKLSGPVGAVKVGEMIWNEFGLIRFAAFAAMISLALAVFNILPIPALDGGRTLSIVIQAVFKIPEHNYFKVENYVNMFFFVLLLGFGVYIILLDLTRFWGVNIPFIGI